MHIIKINKHNNQRHMMRTYNQYHSKDTVLYKVYSTGNTQIKWYKGHWFH